MLSNTSNSWNANLIPNSLNYNFTNNSWHHLSIAYSNSNSLKLYSNGVLHTTFNSFGAVTLHNSTVPFLIGGTETNKFEGELDEIYLYSLVFIY